MKDILKKLLPAVFKPTPISIDYKDGEIVVDVTDAKPLTLRVKGSLKLAIESDFILNSEGEINVKTDGEMICLDSVDSCIHLNSNMCKDLRGREVPNQGIEHFKQLTKETADAERGRNNEALTSLQQLELLVKSMNKRLTKLEEESGNIIDISSK